MYLLNKRKSGIYFCRVDCRTADNIKYSIFEAGAYLKICFLNCELKQMLKMNIKLQPR